MKTLEMPAQPPSAALCLNRILVPTDFSSLSKKALEYATTLAKQLGAELTLVHVLAPEIPPTFDGYLIPSPIASPEIAPTQEKKELKALVSAARRSGVQEVHSMIRRGLASHEIVDTAKELNIDLIVIATHGYTGWKHFCIGSTAERVVRAAPCPVLVVREKEHEFITTTAYADI